MLNYFKYLSKNKCQFSTDSSEERTHSNSLCVVSTSDSKICKRHPSKETDYSVSQWHIHKNIHLVFSPLKIAMCKKRPRTTKCYQFQEQILGSSFEKSVSLVYYTITLGKKNPMIQSGGTRKQLTNSTFSFIEMQQSQNGQQYPYSYKRHI